MRVSSRRVSSADKVPNIAGSRWHLVDRRRVKADIRQAARACRIARLELKDVQRECSALTARSSYRQHADVSERLERCYITLELWKRRSGNLTRFAAWLNGGMSRVWGEWERDATGDYGVYRSDVLAHYLAHYRIEAITALAAIIEVDA